MVALRSRVALARAPTWDGSLTTRRRLDWDVTREALELVGDCIQYGWSPSPSQDEEAWIGDSDEGDQSSADGPAESGPQSSRVGTVPPARVPAELPSPLRWNQAASSRAEQRCG